MIVRVLLRWLINAAAIYLASRTVPGILVEDELALIGVALILGVVNAFIRPILQLLTCPLIILTLGLFTFVLNAFMLLLTARIAEFLDIGFRVDGIVPALLGALVISIVSALLSIFVRGEERARAWR